MVKRIESQSITWEILSEMSNISFLLHSPDCINFQTKLQSMRGEKRSVCGLEASHLRRTCSRTGEAQAAHRAHTACTYFEVVRDTAVSRGALSYMPCLFGQNWISRPNGQLLPVSCLTYSESYRSHGQFGPSGMIFRASYEDFCYQSGRGM